MDELLESNALQTYYKQLIQMQNAKLINIMRIKVALSCLYTRLNLVFESTWWPKGGKMNSEECYR